MTLPEIIQTVADYYQLDPLLIYSRSRKSKETNARNICVYFARKHTKLSTAEIGRILSGRNHSTIWHAGKVVKNLEDVDKKFRREIKMIESELYSKCFQ